MLNIDLCILLLSIYIWLSVLSTQIHIYCQFKCSFLFLSTQIDLLQLLTYVFCCCPVIRIHRYYQLASIAALNASQEIDRHTKLLSTTKSMLYIDTLSVGLNSH